MISDKMKELVKNNSVIREMFEEGKKLKKIYGEENVYDFSLGNPSTPVPSKVKDSIIELLENEKQNIIHGYTSNNGFEDVRDALAKSLNKKYNTNFKSDNFIMTVGAASGLNIVLKSILNKDEEVIVFAPYFSEYKCYIENYDGKIVVISPNEGNNFVPDLKELESKINNKTRGVIINNPNNPTGVVYDESFIKKLSEVLMKKEKELERDIYLISDEPYREIVYDGKEVPFITKYYKDTIVVYSYSKSLAIPGERIGYVIVQDEVKDSKDLITAITIANRVIGCVNAPSLMQKVVSKCTDITCDMNIYDKNRKLLYSKLKEYGFKCIKPEGAFYLFVKSPSEDDKEFASRAKKYNILVVPASSFGCKGYVRIAYCTSFSTIERSLESFKKLAEEYGIYKS